MRLSLETLAGEAFDALVIGAGANGASTAQHLAAEGYRVLLVDRGDFGSGSSSRSSRLLHCGLRYLAPGRSLWDFVRHPGRFATACRMAKAAMACRAEFVGATPERVRPLTFCFPFYDDSAYSAWQIDAAFRLLAALGPKDVPLDYRRLSPQEVRKTPLAKHLREQDRLRGVATFREYQFEWPERIVVDTVLDAERLGAVVRNYTPVKGLERCGKVWRATLADALDPSESPVRVEAAAVFNMAGIWIDRVSGSIAGGRARRRITGTKGSHIVVQLPPDCAEFGIVTLNRKNEPFYCVPWRGLHYFGPTETLYEGDIDDIAPTEEDIAFLIDEANHLLPPLALTREDVLWGWAGVRPLTYDPAQPMGARSRELHDLSSEGLPNMFAMTAGPVMTHRSAGREAAGALRRVLSPSRPAATPSYAARPLPADPASPPVTNRADGPRIADIRRAVREEQAVSLVDVMYRRIGEGWSPGLGLDSAPLVARILGEECGWGEARIAEEVAAYRDHVRHLHGPPDAGPHEASTQTEAQARQ